MGGLWHCYTTHITFPGRVVLGGPCSGNQQIEIYDQLIKVNGAPWTFGEATKPFSFFHWFI